MFSDDSTGACVDDLVPWVEATPVQFRYEPLKEDDAIRLLELEPSHSSEDPVRCKLIHADRSESFQYEILSCDWRSKAKADTVPISINGQTFDAPSEVWAALHKVRLEDRPRLLWTDAICIDQHLEESGKSVDEEERNQQVSRLRDTYQNAVQLLVWLGRASDGSDLVFEHLEKCSGHKHINWCHYRGETEQAFLQLCKRSWFYSVWSAQELALTKRAIILCGDRRSDWLNLMKCSAFLSTGSYYHPLKGPDGRTHLHHLREVSRSNHVQLKNVFLCNRHCQADDHRDNVFSVMAFDISRQLGIPVDYRIDVSELFRIFTQKIIEESRELDVLHWFGSRKHMAGLPSWVPDYSTSDPIGTLPRIFSGAASYSVHYPFKLLRRGFSFKPGGVLSVLGRRIIEKIAVVGDELEPEDDVVPGSEKFQRVLRGWEYLASQLTSKKRFPQAVTDAFSDTLIGNDENDLFIDNGQAPFIIKRNRPAVSPRTDMFHVWYKKYGTGILEKVDLEYFKEADTDKPTLCPTGEPSTEKQRQASEARAKTRLEWYARQMEMTCYGRRFFITNKGSMGLAPPQGRPGDDLVFFPGGKYPFVLRTRDDGTHELVGGCFLYDFDVFALFLEDNIETREFVLT
ncbi:heterokaryon incompatibility protein-domain-containing protein [Xylariaceae sp. FL0662B]|nr:heterokaryon incompatibility protein-domain-containing protein [Xylariaceae sp. FL0662B]